MFTHVKSIYVVAICAALSLSKQKPHPMLRDAAERATGANRA